MSDLKVFTSSDEVFTWMSTFINLERSRNDQHYKLDRMRRLAELAGHPELAVPAIHVAGSKGKGSVTVMTAAVLAAAGYSTARYLSPHVVDYRERVALSSQPFSESLYSRAGDELRQIVDNYSCQPDESGLQPSTEPSFFELASLFFFLCCRQAGVEAAVVEVGLGGRLDATNILKPRLAAIMPIELEHIGILGSTLEAIAGEKAGIIKADTPLVLAAQPAAALTVIRQRAADQRSSLFYLPEVAQLSKIKVNRRGTDFTVHYRDQQYFPKPLRIHLKLVGEIQAYNAALAALAVRLAFPDCSDEAIVAGLAKAELPGRFESLRHDPPLVIDGAHTVASVGLCAELFYRLYGQGGVLVFGCAIDKDAAAMAQPLANGFSRLIITTPGSFKTSSPETVWQLFTRLNSRAELIPDTAAAFTAADNYARQKALPMLVVGSFYLASAVRAMVKTDLKTSDS